MIGLSVRGPGAPSPLHRLHHHPLSNPSGSRGSSLMKRWGCTTTGFGITIRWLVGLLVRDPIGLLGGSNLFSYAPSPTGWTDALGLKGIFKRCKFSAPSGKNHTTYEQDINWDLPVNTRSGTKTNLEIALDGGSPFVIKNGKYSQINLHHSKQDANGSLFELSADTHQNYYGTKALHPHLPNAHPSNPVDRDSFKIDREEYWINRAKKEVHKRNSTNCPCDC